MNTSLIELGSHMTVVMGQAPPGSECNFEGVGTIFVKAGEFRKLNPAICEWTTKPLKMASKEDTLICVVGATAGKVNLASFDCAIGRSVAAVRANQKTLDPGYLFRFLGTTVDRLRANSQGVAQGVITKDMLKSLKLALPPLAEQRRIAALLDQADDLRAKRRDSLALLDSLEQSIFKEMFCGIESHKWPEASIESVASPQKGSIRTGPFGSQLLHSEFISEGISVLGIDNVVANEFRWGQRRYISASKYMELQRYTVHPGDVLISIMGTCGRCAVVPNSIPVAINTKHLCCITLNMSKCLPTFLHAHFLMHPKAREYLGRTAKGAIMAGLNMGIIKDMPMSLPPMPLQLEYQERIAAILTLRKSFRLAKTNLELLFTTLQHRAFRGEL